MKIKFTLNNEIVEIESQLSRRLLDVLREDFHLTGVKEGCGEGECGACAVLLNGNIVNSCSVPLANVVGQDIMTIEGFSKTEAYQIIKESFSNTGAVQCGFCTPGMIIAAQSLLSKNPHPTKEEAQIGLSGNLCRCTGYQAIVDAVLESSKKGEGTW